MSRRQNCFNMPGQNHNKRERFTNELDLEEFAQEWSSGCVTPASITNSWVQISSREMSSASEAEEEDMEEEEVGDTSNRRRVHIGLEETLLKASLYSLLATTSSPRTRKKKLKKYHAHNTMLATSTPIPISQINGSPPTLPVSSLPHLPATNGVSNMLLNNESDVFKHPLERTASRTSVCTDENIPQAILLDECAFEEAISRNGIDSESNCDYQSERDYGAPYVQPYKPEIPHSLALCWSRARSLTPPSAMVNAITSIGLPRNQPRNTSTKRTREISPARTKAKANSNQKALSEDTAEYMQKGNEEITLRLWMAALVSVALFGTGFSIGFGTGYFFRYTRLYATS